MMKKIAAILAILLKSSFAVSLFPYHADLNQKNLPAGLELYHKLNINSCPNPRTIPAKQIASGLNQRCYNITHWLNSSIDFNLTQGNQFLAQQFPLTRNLTSCDSTQQKAATANQVFPAILSSKLALAVLDQDKKYKIILSDLSGQSLQSIVVSNAPITSLAWNKTSNSLAYVSYESGKPVIYIQNIYTAQRYIVANFDGSNSSPAFAESSLLVSLSKDYGTHIYQIDLRNYAAAKIARPLISSASIETEADYANQKLIYTSNKTGKPEIYLTSLNAAQAQQISRRGNNTTGRISNDGGKILYVHGSAGRYDLIYYVLKQSYSRKLDAGKILAGSFAPDNQLIAYIKDQQIILANPFYNHAVSLPNAKYREFFDIKWSKQ